MSKDFSRGWERIMELSEVREKDFPGWTRRAFTEAYNEGRGLIKNWMKEAGLEVWVDPAANLIGCLPGEDPSLPPVLVGSHSDTVLGGGRFDGILGVVGGIEIARALRQEPVSRGLWVVDFTAEEPTEFGISTVGSRALAGTLPLDTLQRKDATGRTLAEAIDAAGGDSSRIAQAAKSRGDFHAGLELHIEQGPVLEKEGKELGVVSGIVGIQRFRLLVKGRADHAGTTPMRFRKDALTAASEGVLALERICSDRASSLYPLPVVGTVGKLDLFPNAPNIVPALVDAQAEIRALSLETLDDITQHWREQLRSLETKRGVSVSLEILSTSKPIVTDTALRSLLQEAVGEISSSWMELPSGAGHDMNQIANLAPVGMLFVPSRDGRSHAPEEWVEPGAVEKGITALYLAVQKLRGQG